jgi:neutral ceramidase
MRWLALFLVCSVFLPVASALAGSSEPLSGTQTWQAGAAAVVITPPEAMWMSGYASRDRPAQGKIHDLFVKALALRDPGGRTAVLLTCDLVGIDRATSQQICRRIQERHQLSRDQVAIATSHTHSGPVVGTNLLSMYSLEPSQQQLVQQYTGLLTDWCVTAADQAVAALQPVQLQVSEGVAKFAVNRRNNREPDVPMLRAEGKLVGPVDHRVPVLAARAADGKLIAVLFGYACHATVLSGMDWCGDWPGFAQLEIEKAHPGTIALFWAGCGADQNPLPRRTVELAMEYGRQAAVAVDQALAAQQTPVQGSLSTVYREIDLALDTLPTREQVEQDLKSENVYLARRARGLIRQFEEHGSLAQAYPYPIQVWSLGDAATLTFLGGEVVVDYSLRIQQELARDRSWVAGYSNDVMAYIPSRRVLMEGGYEGESAMIYYGLPTKWSADVEEHIIREVRSLHAAVAKKGDVQK